VIVSASAASNVTSKITDLSALNAVISNYHSIKKKQESTKRYCLPLIVLLTAATMS